MIRQRKKAIAILVAIMVGLLLVIVTNIGHAIKDNTVRYNSGGFDDCVYVSSATIHSITKGREDFSDSLVADVVLDKSGDSITINASGFAYVGDKIIVGCTVQNDSETDVKTTLTVFDDNLDCISVLTEWDGDEIAEANGGTATVYISIESVKEASETHSESFQIKLETSAIY